MRERVRSNSRSQKRRRSRPLSAGDTPESLASTSDAIWRECIAVARTRPFKFAIVKRAQTSAEYPGRSRGVAATRPWRFWLKCTAFTKTRFAAPTTNSSSRQRPRGAKGRFGPLVDRSCRMQRAAEAGGDPEAAWSYSEPRSGRTARRYHAGARITLRCPWFLVGATPYLRPVVLGP